MVVVLVICVMGILVVYQSFASGSAPRGYTETYLWCKEGNCGLDKFPGAQKSRAFIKDTTNCPTGFVFRGKTNASRTKSRTKDVCIKSDLQLRLGS